MSYAKITEATRDKPQTSQTRRNNSKTKIAISNQTPNNLEKRKRKKVGTLHRQPQLRFKKPKAQQQASSSNEETLNLKPPVSASKSEEMVRRPSTSSTINKKNTLPQTNEVQQIPSLAWTQKTPQKASSAPKNEKVRNTPNRDPRYSDSSHTNRNRRDSSTN